MSGRYRQGGRSSGVAVRRGSTVPTATYLHVYIIFILCDVYSTNPFGYAYVSRFTLLCQSRMPSYCLTFTDNILFVYASCRAGIHIV